MKRKMGTREKELTDRKRPDLAFMQSLPMEVQ